jgi:hypothetical protein
MANNLRLGRDATFSHEKARALGWTPKPASQLLAHPVFHSTQGITFWMGVTGTLWAGEGQWHGQPLYSQWFISALALGTTGILALTAVNLLKLRRTWTLELQSDLAFASYLLSGIALLLVLSLPWEYGDCFAPSRAFPFFTNGRLIQGATIPLILLTVRALQSLTRTSRQTLIAVGTLATICLAIQLNAVLEPLQSPFNYFHLTQPMDSEVLRGEQ